MNAAIPDEISALLNADAAAVFSQKLFHLCEHWLWSSKIPSMYVFPKFAAFGHVPCSSLTSPSARESSADSCTGDILTRTRGCVRCMLALSLSCTSWKKKRRALKVLVQAPICHNTAELDEITLLRVNLSLLTTSSRIVVHLSSLWPQLLCIYLSLFFSLWIEGISIMCLTPPSLPSQVPWDRMNTSTPNTDS